MTLVRIGTCAVALLALTTSPLHAQQPPAVSALGFVEPEGGVIQLSGPVSANGSVVEELRVAEGDRVEAGQVIAVLDTHNNLQAALRKAQAQVAIFEARLEKTLAGASEGKVGAQKEVINRLAAELQVARDTCIRFKNLFQKQVVARATRDEKCKTETITRRRLAEARATLADISDVRAVDVAVNQAELDDAEAAVAQAEEELARALIRAPTAGQILKTHAQPGEIIGGQGVVDLGETDSMWISAEIYETDIVRVKAGQVARITSNGFEGTLQGTVEKIGLTIGRNDLTERDPTADVDARVVIVKIRLRAQDSAKVARLTNLQVSVVIDIDSGA